MMTTAQMIEHQIECKVEKMVYRLDREYMDGFYTESEYHARIKAIDDWAKSESELSEIRAQYANS